LAGLLRFAPQRPFDRGAGCPDMAVEHHLLRFPELAAAEIDALGQAHHRALRAQAPADAAGEAQQHRAAVLGERSLHLRVEMEADGEALTRFAGDAVLAAQILAIAREEELTRMGDAEGRLIAVMTRRDPLRPGILGALARHLARTPADMAVGAD